MSFPEKEGITDGGSEKEKVSFPIVDGSSQVSEAITASSRSPLPEVHQPKLRFTDFGFDSRSQRNSPATLSPGRTVLLDISRTKWFGIVV